MRKLILAGAAALAMSAGGTTGASAAAWCAYYDSTTYNCGFYSLRQCLETISGIGGRCIPNPRSGWHRHGAWRWNG
jgi:hypothetical protein